jgi:hypothetical protein
MEMAEYETSVPSDCIAEYKALWIGIKRRQSQIKALEEEDVRDRKRLRTLDCAPIEMLPAEMIRHILLMLSRNDVLSCIAANKAVFFNHHQQLRSKHAPPEQRNLSDVRFLCDVLQAPISVGPAIMSSCVVDTHVVVLRRITMALFTQKLFPLLLKRFENIVFAHTAWFSSRLAKLEFDDIADLIREAVDNCATPARLFFGSGLKMSLGDCRLSVYGFEPYCAMNYLKNKIFGTLADARCYNVGIPTLNCCTNPAHDYSWDLKVLSQAYYVDRFSVLLDSTVDGLLTARSMEVLRGVCATLSTCNTRINRLDVVLSLTTEGVLSVPPINREQLQVTAQMIIRNIEDTRYMNRDHTGLQFCSDHETTRGIFVVGSSGEVCASRRW